MSRYRYMGATKLTLKATIILTPLLTAMWANPARSAPCAGSVENMVAWLETRSPSENRQRSIRSITSRLKAYRGSRPGIGTVASYAATNFRVVNKSLKSAKGYRTYFSDRGFFRHSRTEIETLTLSERKIRRLDHAAGAEIVYRALACLPSNGLPNFIIAFSADGEPEILTMVLLYEQRVGSPR